MIVFGHILCFSAALLASILGTNNVIVTGSTICSTDFFPCENGECIPSEFWCNSNYDCSDDSDEKYCKINIWGLSDPNNCPSDYYFRCRNGPCIPWVGRCDGIENCADESDEEDCESYHATTHASVVSSTSEPEISNAIRFFDSLNFSQNTIQLKQFSGFAPSSFSQQRNLARNWILSQRKDDYGWIDKTPRAIMALCLSDEQPLVKTESNMLMVKQLEIQFFLELLRNGIKSMKLTDLALHLNAFLVSCRDPKNFYGDNLILALRDRVNAAQAVDEFVNPSIYLTLCISNATISDDVKKLQEIFMNRNETLGRIDIQSLALLATSCIFRKTNYLNESMFDILKMEFLRNVKFHGFPGNVYDAALLFQALQEMKVTLEGLIDFILKWQQADGSFSDILSTYLVLPTLFGKNMVQMTDHCEQQNTSDLTPIAVLKNAKSKKMLVQYSLNYGFPPEIKQTLQMHVAEGTNFLDIMRLAQEINPKYRFKLNENRGVPVVYSIGKMPNDAEKGMYWALYKTSTKNNETTNENNWVPFIGDVKQLIPAGGDKMLFWYRPL